MNEISKALVARAYQKMMQNEPLTRDEEMALDERGFQQMKKTEKEEERLRFLSDPNKSKGMSAAEKRYETSKIWGGRRGGPVAFLAG